VRIVIDKKALSVVAMGVAAALTLAAAPAQADPLIPVIPPSPAPVEAAAGEVPVLPPAPPPPDPLAFLHPAPPPEPAPPDPAIQPVNAPLPNPPPDGVPHLAAPDALPPGATMNPDTQIDENPNVSYLKDLWHAVQNQEISGKEALVYGIAQRGMNTPYPDQAPGPNVPVAPIDPAAAPPPPAPALGPPPPPPADAPPPAPAPAPLMPWVP
jgi:hypothetical protein